MVYLFKPRKEDTLVRLYTISIEESDTTQMNAKRPYKHILKNLFHEQATELIPLLMPGFWVKQVLNVEMPELRTIEIDKHPDRMEEELAGGIAGLVLPGAKITGFIRTEMIEHSGTFERAYRVHHPESDEPAFLAIEFQIEREVKHLPRRLLRNHVIIDQFVGEDFPYEEVESEQSTAVTTYVYPIALCRFPQAVPAPVREMMMSFNFDILRLWENDARAMLNTHVSAIYFLLPGMKNADAALLELAIEELAQRFQGDEIELGRHLTGLSFMLRESEVMSEEEKLATQEHLKRFAHLIKDDPDDQ